MSIISYLYELINEEKCLSCIHNLRWKDRQLECPHCHSLNVGSWGNYHRLPGLERYRCKDCERTFSDLTNIMLSGAKLPMHLLDLSLFCCAFPVAADISSES